MKMIKGVKKGWNVIFLLALIPFLIVLCGCQENKTGNWAKPYSKAVAGQYNFLDTFDSEHLDAEKWEYTIQEFWPPGTSFQLNNLSSLVPQPYDFTLDGNSYIELADGKLVQYVNCSNWYDTIRSWLIWEAPEKDQPPVYFFIWGVEITSVSGDITNHPKDTGHMGFLIALSDEYEQSYFHDRSFYFAIKGLLPRSIGAQPIEGTVPDDLKDILISTEIHWGYPHKEIFAYADEYVEVGQPVDFSWILSRNTMIARWKRSHETEWRQLQRLDAQFGYLRLRFAGSWCEYTVDAVQATKKDRTKSSR